MRAHRIPANNRGVMTTLRAMALFARRGGPLTEAYAAELLRQLGGARTWRAPNLEAFARGLGRWVQARWYFQEDPYGVELVRGPEYQLKRLEREGHFQGDCDDAAVLVSALAVAAGLDARYRVLAFDAAGTLAHVYAQVRAPSGGSWQDADVTRPAGPLLPETAEVYMAV